MENNLDKLFKSKLGGQEPEFHPAAWDRMEGLLDEVGMNPALKKKSNRKKIFYLSLLFLGISVSIIGYMSIMSSKTNGEGSTLVDVNNVIQPNNNKETSNENSGLALLNESDKELDINSENVKSTSVVEASNSQEADSNIERKYSKSFASEKKDMEFKKSELKTTFKNTQPKSLETEFNNQQRTYAESILNTQLTSQGGIDDGAKSNNLAKYPDALRTEETLNEKVKTNVEIIKDEVQGSNAKEILPFLDFLNTRTGILNSMPSLVAPKILISQTSQTSQSSIFTAGIMASARFKDGVGYSVGPYVSYNIGKGYAINLGGQFDSQDFDAGPQMSVIDKVYSFGSKLSERTFSLTNQKSLRIPVTITKSFGGFSLSTGAMVNKVFASRGSISKLGDGSIEENVIIESDMVNPITLSFQLGASVGISRHIDIELGVEYKPKAFVADLSTSNDFNKYYPTVGLRYKLFKF